MRSTGCNSMAVTKDEDKKCWYNQLMSIFFELNSIHFFRSSTIFFYFPCHPKTPLSQQMPCIVASTAAAGIYYQEGIAGI